MSVWAQCILSQCPFKICVPELVSCLALYIHVGLSVWICVGSFYYVVEYTKPRKYTLITYEVKNIEIPFVLLEVCDFVGFLHYVYCKFAKMETHYMGFDCKSSNFAYFAKNS